MSPKEIGDILGKSETYVRNKKNRALDKLKRSGVFDQFRGYL